MYTELEPDTVTGKNVRHIIMSIELLETSKPYIVFGKKTYNIIHTQIRLGQSRLNIHTHTLLASLTPQPVSAVINERTLNTFSQLALAMTISGLSYSLNFPEFSAKIVMMYLLPHRLAP